MSVGKLQPVGAINRDTPLGIERAEQRREKQLGQTARPARDARVDEVAKLYEQQFMREMVRAMRGTVSQSELTKPNMAEQIYRGQLDEQYVENWSNSGGLGLADLIYNELMEKVLDRSAGRGQRPSGPIALTDRDVSRVVRMPTGAARQAPMKVEIAPDTSGAPGKVQAPWEGRVLAQTRVDGRSTVLLEHEGGVRSALIFDGVPTALKPGDHVDGGVPVGILSPEIKSFFWNLSSSPAAASELPDPAKNSSSSEGS